MALLTVTQPTVAGATVAAAAVSASDTITADRPYYLQIINAGGSSDTVTIADAGTTPAGSVATNPTVAVAATTGNKIIYISPSMKNVSTGLVTVTHSFTTSVTYNLYPAS